jgi:hypothetical protein
MKKQNGQIHSTSSGQALVMLLVFMVIAITITAMAVSFVIVNSTAASHVEQADAALSIAESGAENALLRLVRDPTYSGTETLSIDGGTVTATVSATNPIIIFVNGKQGQFTRSIQVQAVFNNTVLTIQSWQEIF